MTVRRLVVAGLLGLAALLPPGEPSASPSPDDPVRVLAIGDSRTSTGQWQAELQRLASVNGVQVEVVTAAVGWVGCFYWTSRIADLLGDHHPDLVVIACGTNDNPAEMIYGEPKTAWSIRYLVETVHAYRPADPIRIVPSLVQYSDPTLAPDWLLANEPRTNDLLYANLMVHAGQGWYPGGIADFQLIPATATYLVADPYPAPPYWIGIHPSVRGYAYMGRVVYDRAAVAMGWPASTEPPLCDLYGHRKGYGRPAYTACTWAGG